jgi:DnaJ-domain-containing protein 1
MEKMKEFIQKLGEGPFPDTDPGRIQRVVFVATFALLAKLVASDDDLNQKELLLIDQLMTETMKLDSNKRKFATKVFNETRKSTISVSELVVSYRSVLKDKPKMYEWLLDILVRISLADEILMEEESKILNEVSSLLGFDKQKLDEIHSRYVKSNSKNQDSYYKTLDLVGSETINEIQSAYDIKMKKYDVTKLISDGFSSELVELAMKRQAEFTTAFMEIRKESFKSDRKI